MQQSPLWLAKEKQLHKHEGIIKINATRLSNHASTPWFLERGRNDNNKPLWKFAVINLCNVHHKHERRRKTIVQVWRKYKNKKINHYRREQSCILTSISGIGATVLWSPMAQAICFASKKEKMHKHEGKYGETNQPQQGGTWSSPWFLEWSNFLN